MIKRIFFFNSSNIKTITLSRHFNDVCSSDYTNLITINVDANNPRYASIDGVLFSKAKDTLVRYPIGKIGTSYTIPNSVTSIGNRAFQNCTGLTSVSIGNGVKSIGNDAFSSCTGLTSISIGNGVKSIGNDAFYNCTGLTSITIPNSVTSIGSGAFKNCTGLTSITIPNSVTSIGDYAFDGCRGLTSISIGNGVTSSNIGLNTFTFCYNVTTINIGSGLTNLFGLPVNNYQKLIDINVDANNPSYTSIDGVLFSKAKDTIFRYPRSRIGAYTIPNSVTSIGDYAFHSCSGLTSVTIPNGVTSIGDYAFYNCTGLTSVTIPNSVTSIGYDAFSFCSGLTSVTMKSTTPPTLSYTAFDNTPSILTIYVPNGSATTYRHAGYWSGYASKIF